MMICNSQEVASGLADILLPPTCPTCGVVLSDPAQGSFCADCLGALYRVTPPLCSSCGLPFPMSAEGNHLCEDCILSPPPFSMARALGRYEGPLLDAIHLFKYHQNVAVGEELGRMMALAAYDSLSIGAYSLIVPVPLHPKRLRERGFNQSLILARQVAKRHAIPLDFQTLRRRVHTEAQVRLAGKERTTNVRGAFAVKDRSRIESEKILLIDDVYTTGSTAMECSRVLMRNGAREVAVLTLAKTSG